MIMDGTLTSLKVIFPWIVNEICSIYAWKHSDLEDREIWGLSNVQ